MKIKIAHITLSMGGGGLENIILKLINNIDKSRFETAIICLDYGGELLKSIDTKYFERHVFNRKPGLDWKLILKLSRLFRKNKYQIIHTHNQAAHFYAGIAAKIAGVPVLITTEHSRHNTANSFIRRYEKLVLSWITDKWVVVSEELEHHAQHEDKLRRDKILTINNGVDNLSISKQHNLLDEKKYFLKKLNLPQDAFIICMIARFHPIKQHNLLLDAFIDFKKSHPNSHILLAGDGECRDELEKKCRDNLIEDNVHFLGFVDDVSKVLQISNVFVLCSESEGLPVSLLEACVYNVPVLITESANTAGTIENGSTGTVVENTCNGLVKGLQWISNNPDQASFMAQKIGTITELKYSLCEMVSNYEALYIDLLNIRRH